MSILKMKFISIVGLKEYFDEFVFNYIIDSSIQLENSLNFLENVKGLSPYSGDNPYYDIAMQSTSLINAMGIRSCLDEQKQNKSSCLRNASNIRTELNELEQCLKLYMEKREQIKEQLNKYIHMSHQLELLANLNVDIEQFFNLEFIKFRFGRIPQKNYKQLQLYLDDLQAIVTTVSQDEDFIWLIYFTPRKYSEKVDGIFSSLYFERVRISGELKGTPSEALKQIKEKISALQSEQNKNDETILNFIADNKEKAANLYFSAMRLNRIAEVRKYASYTAESFYVIGWMPEEDLKTLIPILNKDKKIIYIQEEPDMLKTMQPPTELRNLKIFRPFESLVRMYGLPSYNEVDPTAFVAITYFIMFGLMFGDIGQGLVLAACGLLLCKLKIALGGVVLGAGLSSTIFGFLYGSIFGFEHVIPPLWIKPMDNINTILIFGVATGVVFITSAMILNIINGVKSRDLARILFDRNGIAGFIFYWGSVAFAVWLIQSKKFYIPATFIAILLFISLIAIFIKEPLENVLHRRKFMPHGQGIFIVQTFFELLDTVLSFISNTISFIRLSAFALNHAGLFMAVLILSEMTSGPGSVLAIIIGNIVIIGLEGLIVGIQALRLEYYELFSRFFSGNGRPYKPLKNQYYS